MMDWLIDKLKASGEHTAVIFKEKSYSYAQLAAQVEAYFAIASGRLQPGDIVAIISDYSFESIALFLALSRNRNIVVPITTKVESEIEDRIRVANCRWRIVIGGEGALDIRQEDSLAEVHPLVRQLVDRGRSGLILFSSGSTGRPKAMIHDLDNLIDSYRDKKGKPHRRPEHLAQLPLDGRDDGLPRESRSGTCGAPDREIQGEHPAGIAYVPQSDSDQRGTDAL
jgi:acyl-coenzyme A synthetase/AMP-(fatty) acid ligase